MARHPQNPPPSESKRFHPEEAVEAKERLTRRIMDLMALAPNAPDYVSKAAIALDHAEDTVRDLFGANSDQSTAFRAALMRIQAASGSLFDDAPSVYPESEASKDRVQEAIARLENLREMVDEKVVKGGVAGAQAPIVRRAGGSTAAVKLFISWSGELSHRVALHLKEWLPVVLPFVEAWVSSEDIPKGSRWGAELASQLEGTHSGIVCLVPGNIDEPWLNFEAGALSKSVQKARVHPFLLSPALVRLDGPLGQFQATRFTKDDVKKLVKAINAEAGASTLPPERVDHSFEVCWPDLENRLAPLLAEVEAPPAGIERGSPPGSSPL